MSEHITHLAVYEDAARLALHDPGVPPVFKDVLKQHWADGGLGSLTRSGDRFSVGVLRGLRQGWPTRQPDKRLERRLAFLLGWRCHQAADRRFKPVYRELQPEHYSTEKGVPSDVTVYHDAVIFREVYRSGKDAPYHPSALDYRLETHAAAASVDAEFTQRLFRMLWQESLLAGQSFLRTEKDPAKWFPLFAARKEPFIVDVHRYSVALHHPDPALHYRYIVAPNFYDAADPLLALARSIQRGAPDASIDLKRAVDTAPKQSQFAQAVANGLGYIRASSAFWENKIDEDELKRRFQIGTPHYRPKTEND